jgi:hypothetical protein
MANAHEDELMDDLSALSSPAEVAPPEAPPMAPPATPAAPDSLPKSLNILGIPWTTSWYEFKAKVEFASNSVLEFVEFDSNSAFALNSVPQIAPESGIRLNSPRIQFWSSLNLTRIQLSR